MDVFLGTFRNIWGQLYLRKAILQGGYSESSFPQLRLLDRDIIALFLFTMEWKSYSKLIIYPIPPRGNYATHVCFLKNEILEKNCNKKLWNSKQRRGIPITKEKVNVTFRSIRQEVFGKILLLRSKKILRKIPLKEFIVLYRSRLDEHHIYQDIKRKLSSSRKHWVTSTLG